jgi:hypothetical protein
VIPPESTAAMVVSFMIIFAAAEAARYVVASIKKRSKRKPVSADPTQP